MQPLFVDLRQRPRQESARLPQLLSQKRNAVHVASFSYAAVEPSIKNAVSEQTTQPLATTIPPATMMAAWTFREYTIISGAHADTLTS
jgi:hypothetical protein